MKPQQKTVYFVRHGQSTHNISPVFQSPQADLSDQGIIQAQATAERLAHVPFDALISSPYPRAHQTAKTIADKTGHKIITSELFTERRKPSAVEGKPYDDAAAAQLYERYIQTIYDATGRVEDAENFGDLVARADHALDYLRTRPEATMAVVTHGWFLRVIIARVILGDQLTGETLQRFVELITASNTGITTLHYKDTHAEDFRWRLETLNDRSHFAG